MIKKYCDRCGKEIVGWPMPHSNNFYKITKFKSGTVDHVRPAEIHLCPKCEAELTLWLNNED